MTDTNMADIPFEGDITFEPETENDNSVDSPNETNETEENPSPEGDTNTQEDVDTADGVTTPEPDDKTPFNEHPRWQERENEWNTRFNQQEQRHQEDMRKLREEFSQARQENAEETEIPDWFGGGLKDEATQKAWNSYRKDRDAELKAAEERAYERYQNQNQEQSKAVKEATEYMKSEIATIESDKTLNPTGEKIDPNKLLRIVMDNDLVDSQGRWNYKAAYAIMRNQQKAKDSKIVDTKKKIAGATTSDSKPEDKPRAFKTSDDFKNKPVW